LHYLPWDGAEGSVDEPMAGMSNAAIAAPMSTTAAPITGSAPGNCTFPNHPSATRSRRRYAGRDPDRGNPHAVPQGVGTA
jgi:hypothetical protein